MVEEIRSGSELGRELMDCIQMGKLLGEDQKQRALQACTLKHAIDECNLHQSMPPCSADSLLSNHLDELEDAHFDSSVHSTLINRHLEELQDELQDCFQSSCHDETEAVEEESASLLST